MELWDRKVRQVRRVLLGHRVLQVRLVLMAPLVRKAQSV
jgi:hypothetical protein